MDKFAVDYSYIADELDKPKFYKYEEVKHRLVKVAFDVVRFMDADDTIDGLWKIQKTDEGEVIVAMYDDTVKTACKKTESNWHVFPDRANTSINIFYKNEPIKRIASEEMEIDSNFLSSLCKDVEVKLATDDSFRDRLLNELSTDQRIDLLTRFPEIK
jgi:hypothetical protein